MTRKRPRKAEPPKDFVKKKQKVGKGKRAPENATDGTFKSHSIVIPSQLEQRTDQPTTHRKLTLQDLLGQVGHYKASVKKEALTGICELLQSHPDLFAPNFSKILLQVSPALTDNVPQVRHAFCALLKHLLSGTTLDNMHPFVPVVVAHLICGLTHINEEIQFDSLKIFELLLAHFPTLLLPDAHKLLPLLVRLILRQKQLAETAASSAGKNSLLGTIQKHQRGGSGGAFLASTPHSRLTELDSRLKIFSQLCSFLEVILRSPSQSFSSTETEGRSLAPIIDVENRRVLIPSEDGNVTETNDALCTFAPGIPHVVILKHHGILPSNEAFLSDSVKGCGQQVQVQDSSLLFSDFQQLGDFVEPSISLLLESWIECDPATFLGKEGGDRSSGKNQVLPLMETILNTMCLVLKLVHQSDLRQAFEFVSIDVADSKQTDQPLMMELLRQKYWSELSTHVVSHFPFSVKSQVSPNHLNQILSMDFTLCYIMLLLHATPPPTSVETHATCSSAPLMDIDSTSVQHVAGTICEFFVQIHESGKLVDKLSSAQNAIQSLVTFLPTLLRLCQTNILERERQSSMLESVWAVYKACHPLSSSRQSLVKCFSEQLKITLEQNQDHSRSLVCSELLFPWIQDLPDQLVQLGNSNPRTSGIIISSISIAALHMNTSILQPTVESIFTGGTCSVLEQLPSAVQRKSVELIWYLPLPSLTSALLSKLASCVNSGKYDAGTMRYLVQIVHLRFCRLPSTSFHSSAPLYLSFMLSVVLGYSNAGLQSLQAEQSGELSTVTLAKPREDLNSISRIKTIECACSFLQSSPLSSVVLKLLEKPLAQVLSAPKLLPFDAAVGILKLSTYCLAAPCNSTIPGSLVPGLALLCLGSLVAMETLRPLLPLPSSLIHPLIPVCSNEIETLLRSSDLVLKELLRLFQRKEIIIGFDVEGIIRVFTGLLHQPRLASALRRHREDVLSAALQFSTISSQKSELELVISKFRC